MKTIKVILFLTGLAFSQLVFSQSDAYSSAMMDAYSALKADTDGTKLSGTCAQFERIAMAVKEHWLPFYYASYTNVIRSFKENDPKTKEQLVNHAQELIGEAFRLQGDSDELMVLQGFIYLGKLTVEPKEKSAIYIQSANSCFQKAMSLNGKNPRAFYMEGTALFYTPEFYGGGKQRAKPFFEQAMKKYQSYVPATSLSPDWGMKECEKLLAACQ